MRKTIVFIFSGTLLAAGLFIIGGERLFSSTLYFRFLFAGVGLALVGGYLLWTDFVAPALNVRTWEDD